jgi:enediyne biosynthesis protein E5
MTITDTWIQARRLGGLRRFAIAITVLNILGHTYFGFEQSWAQPLLSLATTYSFELLIEWIEALADGRRPRFLTGWREAVDFLLPAHITGLAVAMLLYSSDRVLPIIFAAAVAIASKATFRIAVDGRMRHFLNPSNFGITVTLLVFPWVSIAPPYHFTENLGPAGSLILPGIICVSGTLINLRFTKRLPLIVGWWAGFVAQAVLRNLLLGTPLAGALNPMTGVAFVLFSFYMISDPATTPFSARSQVVFGLAVAGAYGLLVTLHVAFGLFFALTSVSAMRGLTQYLTGLGRATSPARIPAAPHPVAAMREHA